MEGFKGVAVICLTKDDYETTLDILKKVCKNITTGIEHEDWDDYPILSLDLELALRSGDDITELINSDNVIVYPNQLEDYLKSISLLQEEDDFLKCVDFLRKHGDYECRGEFIASVYFGICWYDPETRVMNGMPYDEVLYRESPTEDWKRLVDAIK